MSSDNDTAPYPPPPPDAGDDEDDAWFEPITYDATPYAYLDAYLAGEDGGDEYAGYAAYGVPEDDGLRRDFEPLPLWQEQRLPDGEVPDDEWPPRGAEGDGPRWRSLDARRPRWVLPAAAAVVAAAVGFGFVMLTGHGNASLPSSALSPATAHPSSATSPRATAATPAPGTTTAPAGAASPGAMAPPITPAQANQVLASYTSVNNTANARASDSLIQTVEAGSSAAIDEGIYRAQRSAGGAGFPAFGPVSASFYIPLENLASYPHWFAVRVRNARLSNPGKVTSEEYLIFTQAGPGAPWEDAVEPFIRPSAQPPGIALDANGYATAVTPNDAGLRLSPAAAPGVTATALDSGAGQPANPGNLADEQDQESLRQHIPSTSGVTIHHSAAPFPLFGLRTTDGGALLFYTDAAKLTVTAPPGSTLRLSVPGFISRDQQLTGATLDYLEQFALYDPPRGHGTSVPVIADYSSLTGIG